MGDVKEPAIHSWGRSTWWVDFSKEGTSDGQPDTTTSSRHPAPFNDGEPESTPPFANVWSSIIRDGLPDAGKHRVQLDLDAVCDVTDSSTPGHKHIVWRGLAVTTDQYKTLLDALVECGIVEPGFASQLTRFGQTYLRIRPDKTEH